MRSAFPKLNLSKSLYTKGLQCKKALWLKKYKIVVDVRGCFWHGHEKCKFSSKPKTNKSFWLEKIERNRQRDRVNLKELKKMGYRVFVVWECKTKEEKSLMSEIDKILQAARG